MNQTQLDAGYDVELKGKNLQEKLPRSNLNWDGQFQFSLFLKRFDFALAQSIFMHLPANPGIARLARQMGEDGAFYATFFIVPGDHPFDHRHWIKTFDDRDRRHYRSWQIRDFCRGLPWRVAMVGDHRDFPQSAALRERRARGPRIDGHRLV